jgi:HEPN domain-containing protein
MTTETKQFLEQARDHYEGAKILMAKGYPTDIIGLLIHQSFESYFKGLLTHWQLDPEENENLKTLFERIVQREKEFTNFEDLCDRVTDFYVIGKLPPDPLSDQAQQEMKSAIAEVEQLISTIEKHIS